MTISFVRHRVSDYEAWRRVYEGVGQLQRGSGVTDESVYRAEGDPNSVLVMHRFGSSQEAHSFFERADLRQAMEDAGVDADSFRLEFYDEV